MSYFNIRVYGILINGKDEVLLSDEREYGMEFTKFPGGGLELGEGLRDGLIREFKEECDIDIEVLGHVHTTDVYLKSAFNGSQVIGMYYLVASEHPVSGRIADVAFDFDSDDEPNQVFRWVKIAELSEKELTFEMDQLAWQAFMKKGL